MIDVDAAFSQELLDIAMQQPPSEIPAHGHQDDPGREPAAGESRPLKRRGHKAIGTKHPDTLAATRRFSQCTSPQGRRCHGRPRQLQHTLVQPQR